MRSLARTLLEQAPETGLPLVLAGDWIADPLWSQWGATLTRQGMDRAQFGEIVAGYANELRLWIAGERPWEHAVSGLAGRVTRRLRPSPNAAVAVTLVAWQEALQRVDVGLDIDMAGLVSRIAGLHLLYDIAPPGHHARDATAIVWAGARPRDPEAPVGEGRGESPRDALTEALGRFLLKDPAYPPRYAAVRNGVAI